MRKNLINVANAAADIDDAFAVAEKSDFAAAYKVFVKWDAWKAGRIVDDDKKPVTTFSKVCKACKRERARKAADKFAAVGLFVDSIKGRAVVVDEFSEYEFGKLYTISYRAGMRDKYETGGLNAARAAAAAFVDKYHITPATSTRDIEAAGKPAKHDNKKAVDEIKKADENEAARLSEKAAQAEKEAAAKHAAALTARKADVDSVIDILRANTGMKKKEFDKLARALRAAAFGDDNYQPSEFIAAAVADKKADDDKKAADKKADDDKKTAARDGKCAGVSNVRVTTPADKKAAANAGGHSVPHKPSENDGAGAAAYSKALNDDKKAAANAK